MINTRELDPALKALDILDGAGEIKKKAVFVATYSASYKTPFADIVEAYESGKAVYLKFIDGNNAHGYLPLSYLEYQNGNGGLCFVGSAMATLQETAKLVSYVYQLTKTDSAETWSIKYGIVCDSLTDI